MKVCLIKPPNSGNNVRGVGLYGERLFESLKSLGVDVNWEKFTLNPFAYQKYDLVHFPFFDLFWFNFLPTFPPIRFYKTVVTCHDLIPLKFPQGYPLGLKGKISWPIQKFLLQYVDAVITDSNSSKKDIEEIANIKNVSVTYLAAENIFKPLNLKRLNFALYVGGGNYNKNLMALVKACQKIKMPLVLVGKEFTKKPGNNVEDQSLKQILDAARMTSNIEIKGFVESNELVKLYNQAKVYVQPSIYEGFGLPVLEALSCGTSVICGNNSSLPEIAGDAVTYVDVEDVNDLVLKIKNIKETGKELKQAAKFSWEKTAGETLKVYEKVLA